MVVVTMIAILAMLATPSFTTARNDRAAFDYARQYQQVLVQGRARASGTGSAHLALLTAGTGGRGLLRLYAALDGSTVPVPVASCKADPAQWTDAVTEPLTFQVGQLVSGNRVRLVNFANLNRKGINEEMDLKASLTAGAGTTNASMSSVSAVAVCVTPSGTTYVGSANTPTDAIANMRASTPFTGIVEASIQRHSNGNAVGLSRRVVIAGGGAARLRSE